MDDSKQEEYFCWRFRLLQFSFNYVQSVRKFILQKLRNLSWINGFNKFICTNVRNFLKYCHTAKYFRFQIDDCRFIKTQFHFIKLQSVGRIKKVLRLQNPLLLSFRLGRCASGVILSAQSQMPLIGAANCSNVEPNYWKPMLAAVLSSVRYTHIKIDLS